MLIVKKINLKESRLKFYRKNKNLIFLLQKRFFWMKNFILKKKIVIELGSGNCLIKNILDEKIICTDIKPLKNLSFRLDMNNLKLNKKFNNNVDVFIFNHSLHHSTNPEKILKIISKKYLKKLGYILINEPELSILFKLFLKFFKHEKYDSNIKNKNKKFFWYKNNATGRILFKNKKIGSPFQDYKVVKNCLSECLIFLNSSGNGVNSTYIKLNFFFLKIIDLIDYVLVKICPIIFALNRSIVLQKI